MKHLPTLKKPLLIALFLSISTFFVNCSQEDDINAQKLSISNFVQAQTNLTTLGIELIYLQR